MSRTWDLHDQLGGLLHVAPAAVGMHLMGWLQPGAHDVDASRRAAAQGVYATPLSAVTLQTRRPPALVLGYMAVSETAMQSGVRRLARALQR